MSYKDVRGWIEQVDAMGELKTIHGAVWNLEIGSLSVLASKHKENSPALLFDRIKDYPVGYRILVGFFESLKRSALTTNLSLDITREGFIQAWRQRLATPESIPPTTVATGPVLENVFTADDIDLFKFPVPRWHERDGGRYIGTGHVVITRDPDEGWVNVGCYRVMVHDRNTMGMNISPGKHGRMHRQKYFDRGKPCPVVCCFGVDPLLHMIATRPEPYGRSEFDAVGGIKGEPVEVILGKYTGLPIPAYAEIAVEGEFLPDQGREKGPFSEWTGYYASGEKLEPLIRVHRLYHRDDPIITASPEYRPTARAEHCYELLRAAYIRDQVEKAGVPDVAGVASYFRRSDRDLDPPALSRPLAPSRPDRQPMSRCGLLGALRRRGRRRHRRLRHQRCFMGDVQPRRSGRLRRNPAALLERSARPDHPARAQGLQLAHDYRRLPSV